MSQVAGPDDVYVPRRRWLELVELEKRVKADTATKPKSTPTRPRACSA